MVAVLAVCENGQVVVVVGERSGIFITEVEVVGNGADGEVAKVAVVKVIW